MDNPWVITYGIGILLASIGITAYVIVEKHNVYSERASSSLEGDDLVPIIAMSAFWPLFIICLPILIGRVIGLHLAKRKVEYLKLTKGMK